MSFDLIHAVLLFMMFVLALVLSLGTVLLRQERLERRLDFVERLGVPQKQPEAFVYDPRTQQSISLQEFQQGDPLTSLSSWEKQYDPTRLTSPEKLQDENGDVLEEILTLDDV